MTGGGNQVWDSKLEYILSAVGYAVGLGNIWKFPFECYTGGGGAFLLPYIVMMVIVGFPLMLLETSLGQFTSSGPIKAYKCVPLFQGLGYAMMVVSALIGIFYNVILSWNLFYIIKSISFSPEYNTCRKEWGDACSDDFVIAINDTCKSYPQEYFFRHQMLQFEPPQATECLPENSTWNEDHSNLSITNFGGLNIHLAATLLISWLIIMFVVIRGVQTSGKIMIYITLFPAVAMILMLIRGLFLPGAWDGISAFLKPDFAKVNPFGHTTDSNNVTTSNSHLWIKATGQIFFSMSIGLGGLTTLSSYNQFRGNIFKDTLIILCSDFIVSMVSGLTVFTYIGYMANSSGATIKNVATAGPGLVFKVWPFALSKIFGQGILLSIICFVFFSMIYSTGISSMAGLTETIINCLDEITSKYNDQNLGQDKINKLAKKKRSKLTILVVVVCFILGLPMVMKNGILVFNVMAGGAVDFSLIMIAIFELIGIMYIYGHDRFLNDIRMMVHKREVPKFIITSWRFIAPVLLGMQLINMLVGANYETVSTFGGVEYKTKGAPILFFINVISPLTLILVGALDACGVLRSDISFRKSTIPDVDFGPAADSDRIDVSRRLDNVVYSTTDMKCGIEV